MPVVSDGTGTDHSTRRLIVHVTLPCGDQTAGSPTLPPPIDDDHTGDSRSKGRVNVTLYMRC